MGACACHNAPARRRPGRLGRAFQARHSTARKGYRPVPRQLAHRVHGADPAPANRDAPAVAHHVPKTSPEADSGRCKLGGSLTSRTTILRRARRRFGGEPFAPRCGQGFGSVPLSHTASAPATRPGQGGGSARRSRVRPAAAQTVAESFGYAVATPNACEVLTNARRPAIVGARRVVCHPAPMAQDPSGSLHTQSRGNVPPCFQKRVDGIMKEYRLAAWPQLRAPFDRIAHRRMLSDMSHRHMTMAQLGHSSGIRCQEVRAFIEMLGQDGVIVERDAKEPQSLLHGFGPLKGWLRRAWAPQPSER